MEKNARLADIYIKIYNKQPLIMEDLSFLAKYDRECFEKTCRNLIYNMPKARELMQPIPEEKTKDGQNSVPVESERKEEAVPAESGEVQASQIRVLLDNLKKIEWQEMPKPDLDADKVKNLLGSLYMEMLFPHNDRYRFFNLEKGTDSSIFNRKV